MKKITVRTASGELLKIEAPDDKVMTVDQGLLAHGILSIGEYGPSGTKVAVFNDWTNAVLFPADSGYTITEVNPF